VSVEIRRSDRAGSFSLNGSHVVGARDARPRHVAVNGRRRDADASRQVQQLRAVSTDVGFDVHGADYHQNGEIRSSTHSPIWCWQDSPDWRNYAMGNQMRTYRLEAGLTLEQLAERMGTSVQQVSRLEKGQRKLTQDWMLRAAAALGIPPAALFDTAQPPDVGEMVKDRSEISLLRFWRDLDGSQRELFVKMLGAESGEIDDAA